jgi:hypothetical protein
MTRTVIPCVVQSEKLAARVRLYIRKPVHLIGLKEKQRP